MTDIVTYPRSPRLKVDREQGIVTLYNVSGEPIAHASLEDAIAKGYLVREGSTPATLPPDCVIWLRTLTDSMRRRPAAESRHSEPVNAPPSKPKSAEEARLDDIRANLAQFSGSETFTRLNPGLWATDGTLYLAQAAGAFWLMDIIWSYRSTLKAEEFQVWTISFPDREKNAAVVICEDGNGNELVRQEIPYTDFPLKEGVKLYVCVNGEDSFTVMLPGEY